MPLEGIAIQDPLTQLIDFKTSAVYEMLVSLISLMRPYSHAELHQAAHVALPGPFWDDLAALYEPFHNGKDFLELAVDAPDHLDVPGFIDYIRTMDDVSFMFYLIGRVIPRARLAAAGLTPAGLKQAFEQQPEYYQYFCGALPMDSVLADLSGFKHQLADLWQAYWEGFFGAQVPQLHASWSAAIAHKETLLARLHGSGLLEYVTGKSKLPRELPADQPYRNVIFVPLRYPPVASFMFFGYGNITILFDCARRESRRQQIEQATEEALASFKALGDANRLKILRTIAHNEGYMNGKKIAEKLGLSTSAVSRHLGQLKDGGLIVEQSEDNRNITYRLQKDYIKSLPDKLMNYLFS